jgi:hypothetical protein
MKKYILLGVLGAASFFLWWSLNSKDAKQSDESQMAAIELPKYDRKNIEKELGEANLLSASSSPTSSISNHLQYHSADFSNTSKLDELPSVNSWKKSVGYFSDEELNEYGRMSKNVLEELAKNGDIQAIQTLAGQEVYNDLDRAKELYYQAAVHGSIKAIQALKWFKASDYQDDKKPENAMEALAYLQVEVKRGNVIAQHGDIEAFSELYNFYPDEEQKKYIANRSNQIMEDLERRRRGLGLPEFDNRPAKEFKELYDRMNRENKNPINN